MRSPTNLLRRRSFRLGLRGLMILVVLVAVPVGWETNQIRGRRAAVDALSAVWTGYADFPGQDADHSWVVWARQAAEDRLMTPRASPRTFEPIQSIEFDQPVAGEVLAYLPWIDELESLQLRDTSGVRMGWEPLARLPHLETLQLSGPGVTDEAMQAMGRARSLKSLSIDRAAATDAGFAVLAGLPDLKELTITRCPALTDAGLARLLEGLPRLNSLHVRLPAAESVGATVRSLARHHPELGSLDLGEHPVVDADVASLAEIAGLRWLSLIQARVTDTGLFHLRRLPKLETIRLDSTEITDAGLEDLGALTRLSNVSLASTAVTGVGLAHLARLPSLRNLDLSGTRVTDAELAHLARLTSLRILDLSCTRVTDAGLASIARIVGLVKLDLRGLPGLTDAGLAKLHGSSKLFSLDIRRTGVTNAGVAALKQNLPRIRVER